MEESLSDVQVGISNFWFTNPGVVGFLVVFDLLCCNLTTYKNKPVYSWDDKFRVLHSPPSGKRRIKARSCQPTKWYLFNCADGKSDSWTKDCVSNGRNGVSKFWSANLGVEGKGWPIRSLSKVKVLIPHPSGRRKVRDLFQSEKSETLPPPGWPIGIFMETLTVMIAYSNSYPSSRG